MFALKFREGGLDGPSTYRSSSLMPSKAKLHNIQYWTFIIKELVKANKINVNQIKSMENRFCQTELTTFLMRLQV